jgi:hypothetical protein
VLDRVAADERARPGLDELRGEERGRRAQPAGELCGHPFRPEVRIDPGHAADAGVQQLGGEVRRTAPDLHDVRAAQPVPVHPLRRQCLRVGGEPWGEVLGLLVLSGVVEQRGVEGGVEHHPARPAERQLLVADRDRARLARRRENGRAVHREIGRPDERRRRRRRTGRTTAHALGVLRRPPVRATAIMLPVAWPPSQCPSHQAHLRNVRMRPRRRLSGRCDAVCFEAPGSTRACTGRVVAPARSAARDPPARPRGEEPRYRAADARRSCPTTSTERV